MILKFEETCSLTIRSGKGRKLASEEVIVQHIQKNVATAIVDRPQTTIAGCSTNTRSVPREQDLNASKGWKVLRRNLHYYVYKISCFKQLQPVYFDKRLIFAMTFLARMDIDYAFQCRILRGMMPIFF